MFVLATSTIYVFVLGARLILFLCFWLPVPVQMIAWKDISKMNYYVSTETLNPTKLIYLGVVELS